STLFNQLKGEKLSQVSAVPGTTSDVISEEFGPFWLSDTPGFDEVSGSQNAERAMAGVAVADVAILVLDASAGVRQSDAQLYQRLRDQSIPVVVALNKIDLVRRDLDRVIADAERKLGTTIIPISAKQGTNVANQLIPALLDSHPRLAVAVGRGLPEFRRKAAMRVVREAAGLSSVIGFEPIPGLAIPFLMGVQAGMFVRLAAIYGEALSVSRARELIGAMAGGIAVRYGAQEAVKFIPGPGWLIAGFVAGSGTFALGRAAIAFFENSDKLSPEQLRNLYRSLRFRRKKKIAELEDEQIDAHLMVDEG
ncbi:MAG: GTP-binding protein, partial [Chloroflexi bacterium]|nr:GTP-binding protein [Chloroflexota bacterium]